MWSFLLLIVLLIFWGLHDATGKAVNNYTFNNLNELFKICGGYPRVVSKEEYEKILNESEHEYKNMLRDFPGLYLGITLDNIPSNIFSYNDFFYADRTMGYYYGDERKSMAKFRRDVMERQSRNKEIPQSARAVYSGDVLKASNAWSQREISYKIMKKNIDKIDDYLNEKNFPNELKETLIDLFKTDKKKTLEFIDDYNKCRRGYDNFLKGYRPNVQDFNIFNWDFWGKFREKWGYGEDMEFLRNVYVSQITENLKNVEPPNMFSTAENYDLYGNRNKINNIKFTEEVFKNGNGNQKRN